MTPKTMKQTAQVKSVLRIPHKDLEESLNFIDEARSHNQSRSQISRWRCGFLFILFAFLTGTQSANAQLTIPVIRGDNGLKSGSQPPPGVFVTGVLYVYDANETVDKDGKHSTRTGINQAIPATALTYVSKKKFLGANYSATVVFPLLNVVIDTPVATNTTGVGYSDMYVQPLQLGWHKKRYDALVGYGLFMPTGRFTAGASNNHGLGMWSHEISAGTTIYLDSKQKWHAATNAYYNIQSHIKDTNRKAGNVLSLEGGVGRTLCSHLCNVGVDYYTQWKVTSDTLPNVPPNFVGKHRYYGIGPEVNGVIPINAKTLAIFKLAYFKEFGNLVATQGQAIIMSVTLAKPKH
jgi:hypothetical protein